LIAPRIKARMRREMSDERPTIRIGRNGATDQLIAEVLRQLDRNEMIKIKILRSALKSEDSKIIINKIIQQTESTLIDQRGHVFVLYRRRKRKKPL